MRFETYNIQTGKLPKDSYLGDFFINVRDVPEHPDYPEHDHEFTELVVVYEGTGINCVDGYEYPMMAGDVFVIHSGRKHSYKDTNHLHLCNVVFDSDRLGIERLDMKHLPGFHLLFHLEPNLRKPNFNSRLHLQNRELMKARAIIEEIEQEVDERKPGYRLVSQSMLLLLLGKLGRWFDQVSRKDSSKLLLIAKSIAHMEQNLYESLSIAELAKMANTSERAFYRVFHKATGCSPNHYLNDLRLTQARELLKFSNMSITDIAQECGFQDNSYMTRQFKKQQGVTPSAYRKMVQK